MVKAALMARFQKFIVDLPSIVSQPTLVVGSQDGSRFVKATARDRKSTRLNSSHSQISYAVFCLNKNKYVRNCVFPFLVAFAIFSWSAKDNNNLVSDA